MNNQEFMTSVSVHRGYKMLMQHRINALVHLFTKLYADSIIRILSLSIIILYADSVIAQVTPIYEPPPVTNTYWHVDYLASPDGAGQLGPNNITTLTSIRTDGNGTVLDHGTQADSPSDVANLVAQNTNGNVSNFSIGETFPGNTVTEETTFSEPITNPYFIFPALGIEFLTTVQFFDCNDVPVPVTLISTGTPVTVMDNTVNNPTPADSGPFTIQVQDNVPRTCIKYTIMNQPNGGGTDNIRIGIGVFYPVPPDCNTATATEICDFITSYPTNPFASEDCDVGGVDNATECSMGTDPTDPSDDGSTPSGCPAGESIYTVFHIDETQGYLPGGICVETSLTGMNSGILKLSDASALNSVFVNTTNNITAGGALSYTKTQDGDDFSVEYLFCSDVVDPYIYIGKTGPEKNTIISIFESDGTTPIPLAYVDGQTGFSLIGSNQITSTINNRVGYVQIQDGVPRSSIVVDVVNGVRYGLDAFRIGVGVCAPDIMQSQPVCPIGLFSWEKDGVEQYKVYVDGNGVSFYAKDDLCTESSLGDVVFDASGPICGTLVPISTNCLTTMCENIVASGSPYTPTGPVTAENDCPEESVLLSDFVSPAFVAASGVVSYHNATPVSVGNQITNLTIAANGTYYVAYTVPGQTLTEFMQIDVLITPCDPCDAAYEDPAGICGLINGDPNHPLANLDCDEGGVNNITECNNGLDPDNPSDDAIPCNAGQVAPVLIGN